MRLPSKIKLVVPDDAVCDRTHGTQNARHAINIAETLRNQNLIGKMIVTFCGVTNTFFPASSDYLRRTLTVDGSFTATSSKHEIHIRPAY